MKYNTEQIMADAKARHTSGTQAELKKARQEAETLKLEHSHMKRKLSVYEKKEKDRLANLKKAREAKTKKRGGKKR